MKQLAVYEQNIFNVSDIIIATYDVFLFNRLHIYKQSIVSNVCSCYYKKINS